MKKRKSLSAVFKHIFDEIEILLTMFLSKAIQVGRLMTEEELLHLIEPLLVYMEHGNSAFTEEKLIAQASGLQKKGSERYEYTRTSRAKRNGHWFERGN